jgi:CheY-like chemotaxis protein
MPYMNGYQVARALRADPAQRHAVLVALTGWGAEDDKRRAKEAGYDFHLTKPIEVDQVTSLLARLDAARV